MDPQGTKLQSVSSQTVSTMTIETAVPLVSTVPQILSSSTRKTDAGSQLFDNSDNQIRQIKRMGTALGIVVGIFIQFASLGANFVLMSQTKRNEIDSVAITHSLWQPQVLAEHGKQIVVAMSLSWSFITSSLGVAVLCILSALLVVPAASFAKTSSSSAALRCRMRTALERSYATGALIGVCLSWASTDMAMGIPSHAIQSLLTLVAALAMAKLIACCLPVDDDDSNDDDMEQGNEKRQSLDLEEPLLEKETGTEDTTVSYATNVNLTTLQGILIGCFVQFSSLGANFLLEHLSTPIEAASVQEQHRYIMIFSLAWSIGTSLLGVAVWVLTRWILLTAAGVTVDQELADESHEEQNSAKSKIVETMVDMESFYSTGAIAGVNMAWIVSDWLLGPQLACSTIWNWGLIMASLLLWKLCLRNNAAYNE